MELIKGGKLRALGMVNASRIGVLSDVPTMKELGFESVNWQPWAGIGGPAGLRKEVVDAWNDSAKAFFADQKFLAKVENLGFTPAYLEAQRDRAILAADKNNNPGRPGCLGAASARHNNTNKNK